MKRAVVVEKLQEIVKHQLGVDEKHVDDLNTAHIETDLGADSLDLVELIMSIEEEFGIDIPDEDAEKIHNVNQMLAYLGEQVEITD